MRQLKITASITTHEPVLNIYLREIGKVELLTPEQEVRLAEQIKKGDKNALDELTRANLRFVVSVAKKYQGQGLTLTDMINEGNLGLIEAAHRFDPTRGFKFTSYAVWYIRQRIMVALSDYSKLIRIPINRMTVRSRIYKTSCMMEQQLDRTPSVEELAEVLEMETEEVNKCINEKADFISFDRPISDDEDSGNLYDLVENPDARKTEKDFFQKSSLKIELNRILTVLSDKQKEVLFWFYGIDIDRALSLEEIADKMHLTRERVRQIRDKGIEKLREICDLNQLRGFLVN
jgi:RNA polymerase primary sigma factor